MAVFVFQLNRTARTCTDTDGMLAVRVRACVGGGGDGVVKMIELKMLERMKMFGWCVGA